MIRVDGIEETAAAFDALDKKVRRRVLPKVARAGGALQLKEARRTVPRVNRHLASSLALVIRRYAGAAVAVIGQDTNKVPRGKKRKTAGGISGSGAAAPIHLVENPVRPHAIRPTSATQLRFTSHGQVIYARRVQHPGHRGTSSLARAAASTQGTAQAAAERKLAEELAKEAGP